MNTIHLVIAGKGGVGKSYVAALLTQYLSDNGRPVVCVDTDTNNGTFSAYEAFNARRFSVLDSDFNIHKTVLDSMLEYITSQDSDVVIDVGASSFSAFCSWMKELDLTDIINTYGRQMVAHLVMEGGTNAENAFIDLDTVKSIVNVPIIIWENGHRGPVMLDGVPLAELDALKDMPAIISIIVIPETKSDTLEDSIRLMTSKHLTFRQIDEKPEIFIVHKSRLKTYWKAVWEHIDAVMGNNGGQ